MSDTLKSRVRLSGKNLTEVATALGVDKSSVTRWSQNRVPAERVLDVERVTGIPRHELRPDIFGPAPLPKTRGSNAGVAAS